jgi:pyruvate dehydrogenase E2 component (dihydrolipoamide acetyltransferase)
MTGTPRATGSPRVWHNVSVRRRLAVATWRPSKDGRIYARMAVDATALLAYVDDARTRTGVRVTVTHVVGAALARAIREVPEVRARVVLGRIVSFDAVDIGFAVDIDGGSDLAPVKVRGADVKSPVDIARDLESGASRLRAGDDAAHSRSSAVAAPAAVVVAALARERRQPVRRRSGGRHVRPTGLPAGSGVRLQRRVAGTRRGLPRPAAVRRGCRSTSRSAPCATPRSWSTAR